PEKIRIRYIICVRPRICATAIPASVKFENPRTTVTDVTWLTEQRSSWATSAFRRQRGAVGIHADPQPRKTSIERVNSTGEQPWLPRVSAGKTPQSYEGRDSPRT